MEPPAQTAMEHLVQEAVVFAAAVVRVISPPPKEALPNRSRKPLPVFPVTKMQDIFLPLTSNLSPPHTCLLYAPVETLRTAWEEAMAHESVATLAIATRSDCLGDDVLSLLADCCRKIPVTVELGLQTIHPNTIRYIRRGYPNSVYETAVKSLKNIGVNVVTHVIAGLPGETKENFIDTVRYVADIGSDGIKLQLLHVLKGTDLALDYEKKMFRTLTPDEYLDYITEALSILPPDMVIHRVTGDGPKDLLIAPLWSANKRMVLNSLHQKMKQEHIFQGKFYHGK